MGALVGCADNCGFSAVAVVGRRPVLGQGRCARWCNDWERAMLGSTMDTCSQFPGGFWTNFYDFHVAGWTRDPEVNSRRFSCVRCLEEVAALVVDYGSGMRFSWFCWFFAPRAVFPTIAGRSKFLLMSSCTWKSVHYFYDPVYFQHFSAVEILR